MASLVKSPLYPRLKTLDLSQGNLTSRGASALAGAKRKTPLQLLTVVRNRLDKRAAQSLGPVAEKVLIASQRK